MPKNIITTIIVIIVIAGGVFLITKKPATPDLTVGGPRGMTQTNENPNGPDYQPNRDMNGAQTNGKKMAFDVFLKQGVQGASYECTVHQSVNNVDTTGKVWIDGAGAETGINTGSANAKMHGEFTTSTQGMNITSNFTMVNGYSYSWSSMSNTGYKVKIPADSTTGTNTNASANGSYSWDASQIGDYDCQVWTAVPAKFELPKSIKFTEIKVK